MRVFQSTTFGIATVAFSTFLMAGTSNLFSTGSPRSMTGAPGEDTCATSCHNEFVLNSGQGSIDIIAPTEYSPSEIFDVTIQVTDPFAIRFGFAITAMDAFGNYVGAWDVTDPTVKLSGGSTDHVTHSTAPFVPSGNTPYEWTLPWTAPTDDVGTITFYAAGNAADGSGSTSGDNIYSVSKEVVSRGSLAAEAYELPSEFTIHSVFPNPFSDRAVIVATLEKPTTLSIELYDLAGRRVKSVSLGMVHAGLHEWAISGEGLTAGPVLYRLHSDVETRSGLLIYTR